jgi:protein-S-isoprenylcysteine O-methyltransferase Ste14
MRHENETPANRRRRLHAAIYRPYTRASTMLVVVLVVLVGILEAIAVGPGRVIDWLVNYLIPVGVVTGVVIATVALLLYAFKRLPDSPPRDWWQ